MPDPRLVPLRRNEARGDDVEMHIDSVSVEQVEIREDEKRKRREYSAGDADVQEVATSGEQTRMHTDHQMNGKFMRLNDSTVSPQRTSDPVPDDDALMEYRSHPEDNITFATVSREVCLPCITRGMSISILCIPVLVEYHFRTIALSSYVAI